MLAPNTNLENIYNPSLMLYLNTKNRRNLFSSQSGYVLIIPYQLSKFQAPSLNSFCYILLTSLKGPNFQRGHKSTKNKNEKSTPRHP